MVSSDLWSENISIAAFKQLLELYPGLIQSLSDSKASKEGQKTLFELDNFRYGEAVELFSSKDPKRPMNHEDVKILVEWKLRHGKFRPTLMKLVSSNDGKAVEETISKTMGAYWKSSNASAAVDGISKLKGVGPATASLLLSVHDPDRVIFFSDEAFWWLCCNGKKDPIKYNTKEYKELNESTQALVKRLRVSATDVEKVAYVLAKDVGASTSGTEKHVASPIVEPASSKAAAIGKRKQAPEDAHPPILSLRRSKRAKKT